MEYETLRPYSVEQIGKALEKVGIFPEQKRINGSPKKVRELPFPKYGVRALAWGVVGVVGCSKQKKLQPTTLKALSLNGLKGV